ncbi:hypothetical protein CH63R_14343 [Colletotrichum higginsianum IMI 349063]|uniref:Uncharacterized protein n=2 Tax=Colletotrichum higginsianum TaxID=80884 RepID=A0A1B7XTL8_COLHI|nr:hypothetical protein CH63R_14343 [Colletotrichum higginsianum IMI 349063]OBR03117.1 hypothetical protein CH63R_14343 [Colletotrichum higginsianum IMI 349063]TIC91292.1 hypothetical protein CH35J_011078 [Colletotrichum higginsianum]
MAPAWLEKYIVRADTTPDSRRSNEQPALEIHYTVLQGHRRILGVQGDKTPRYEVKRRAVLGAWGDKCDVTAPVDGGREVAVIDFHAFPPKTDIQFPQRNHEIIIKASEGHYESSGGLGRLHWKPTGMVAYGKASWELRDESDLVMSVAIDDNQLNGLICLWRDGLDQQTVEELVVVGISQVEDYKKLNRKAKISAVGAGTNAAWLVGGSV